MAWWIWVDFAGALCAIAWMLHATTQMQRVDVLLALLQGPDVSGRWWYGLELVQHSKGVLKRGSIYVLLHLMEEGGYIESRQEEHTPEYIGIPRRIYRITDKGIAYHQDLIIHDRAKRR
jgi:hypothetical protein